MLVWNRSCKSSSVQHRLQQERPEWCPVDLQVESFSIVITGRIMPTVPRKRRITTSHDYFCDAATAAAKSATAAAATALPLPNDKHLQSCTGIRARDAGFCKFCAGTVCPELYRTGAGEWHRKSSCRLRAPSSPKVYANATWLKILRTSGGRTKVSCDHQQPLERLGFIGQLHSDISCQPQG